MTKQRLDIELTKRGLTPTRSQAESWIKMGKVTVDGRVVTKPGQFVRSDADVAMTAEDQYVSRAGLKLASVAEVLKLDFRDYSLRHGAQKVYAVDVGTDQLHPSLHGHPRIELHEKTDIRDFYLKGKPDIIVIDVSFISLREILPHIHQYLSGANTEIIAMVKPQFEAGKDQTNKGIIKNDSMRRQILKDFETWSKELFVIADKRDSDVAGAKGNQERFYKLKRL
jgi:23S rRNA (cytidine1920-2'-O)/16S rRNA (cytidine1409-2'-O)-methyltransferase